MLVSGEAVGDTDELQSGHTCGIKHGADSSSCCVLISDISLHLKPSRPHLRAPVLIGWSSNVMTYSAIKRWMLPPLNRLSHRVNVPGLLPALLQTLRDGSCADRGAEAGAAVGGNQWITHDIFPHQHPSFCFIHFNLCAVTIRQKRGTHSVFTGELGLLHMCEKLVVHCL